MDIEFLMAQNIFLKMDHKITEYFTPFLNVLMHLKRKKYHVVLEWKSKDLSEENIKSQVTSNKNFNPKLY